MIILVVIFSFLHFRFGIYSQPLWDETESKALEEFFKSQGHSASEPGVNFRQKLKNLYIEVRYGFNYYNFPWELKSFGLVTISWIIGMYRVPRRKLYFLEGFLYRNYNYV